MTAPQCRVWNRNGRPCRLRAVRTSKLLPLILLAACGGPKKPTSEPVPSHPVEPTPAPTPTPAPAPAPAADDSALVKEAKQFVADADGELRKLNVDAAVAE